MANIPDQPTYFSSAPSGQHTWLEPESPANEENPPIHCKVWETESGHSIQLDDTLNRERVRIEHRSKTFLEMHPNGDEVHNIKGDGYEIIARNKNVLIKGVCSITVEGDCIFDIKGNKIENIEGDFIQNISGNFEQNVKKSSFMNSTEDVSIGVSGLTGSVTIQAADNVVIDSDCIVKGDIAGVNMTAQAKVNGKTGVTAGYLGFVSSTGGLAIGAPVAIPGQIMCAGNLPTIPETDPITGAIIVPPIPANPIGNIFATGTINAALTVNAVIAVNAPFIYGFMVSDVAGTMFGMRATYNSHIHPAPRGVTGTPVSMMTLL